MRLICLLACLAAVPALAQTPEDRVNEVMAFISGPEGKVRDWESFRNFFAPNAQIAFYSHRPEATESVPTWMSLEEFVRQIGPRYRDMTFAEETVNIRTLQYNGIAVIWQQYECSAAGRTWQGVNAYTLMQFDGTWRITHLSWANDGNGVAIPQDGFDH